MASEYFVKANEEFVNENYHKALEAKQIGMDQLQKPAMEVVEDVILSVPEDQHFLLPKQKLLKRSTNRYRAKSRPQEPKELDFELAVDYLQCDEFLIADLRVENQRHLVFASPFQLQLLRQTKRWFMDGTFKVCPEPFRNGRSGQFFSINCFIQSNGQSKQFPLVFVLMSRKHKEDYDALYTEAISKDDEDSKDEYYAARAQVLIKLERYAEALEDTNTATELNPKNSKAYYRRGIALFNLERYEDALKVFTAGHVLDLNESDTQSENNNFKTWIRKCEAELDLSNQEKVSGAEARVGMSDSSPMETSQSTGSDVSHHKKPAPTQPQANIADSVLSTQARAKYDWYQTQTHVIVNILIKNVNKDTCKVDLTEKSLSATLKLPTGSDYSLELDLSHSIIPEKSVTKVLTSKVEIKMKKQQELQWKKLEYDGQGEEKVKQIPVQGANDTVHKYPTSSHYTRNWDKLEQEVKEEEKNEKLEGDAALNKLFQQIYSDGSDETKKAMMKSFSESGGTVLSTNWGEIGNKKTEVKPPDGMEYKKWEL